MLGVPLSASTQWDIISSYELLLEIVYKSLLKCAANGKGFYIDDTSSKILEVIKKRTLEGKKSSKCYTTGIISVHDDYRCVVFINDEDTAGKSFSNIFKLRNKVLIEPYIMMDALTANIPKEIVPQSRFLMPVKETRNLPTGIKTAAIGPNKRKFKMSINQLGTSLYAQMKTSPVPGLFKLEIPTMFADELSWLFEKKSNLIPFVVSLNRDESLMSALSDGALADITKYVDIMSTSKLEDVQASIEGKSFGKEIWRFLAVGVLFLVIAEIVLSRWIAVQRRTGKAERVKFEENAT
jgi:hypothetical protein